MSTTYEETTTTQRSTVEIGVDSSYPRSIPGILKIIEMILCLIGFICSCIPYWASVGGGWVDFVTIMGFIWTGMFFVFHLLRVIYKFHQLPWTLIEFIYYCIWCVFLLIAGIVAATKAPYHGAIAAATFFVFAALVAFAIDTFFMFRDWRSGPSTTTSSTHTTGGATNTTTTTYETRTSY